MHVSFIHTAGFLDVLALGEHVKIMGARSGYGRRQSEKRCNPRLPPKQCCFQLPVFPGWVIWQGTSADRDRSLVAMRRGLYRKIAQIRLSPFFHVCPRFSRREVDAIALAFNISTIRLSNSSGRDERSRKSSSC